jgi:twitching motility protein PilT
MPEFEIPENRILKLLKLCRKSTNSTSVSDAHIVENDYAWIRVDGKLIRFTEMEPITDAEIKNFCESVLNLGKHLQEEFERNHYISTSLHNEDVGEVRVHMFRKNDGLDLVIRLLNPKVPAFETLGLPDVIKTFADTPNGLYLFTGATGSGKSTALAALINEINKKYQYSIFTVEDPIEYHHESLKSLVRQFAIGQDIVSYDEAIRSFLRADPDVILIGEMRDEKTMEAALRAAETGHLVFSTVHDNGAAETCQRIIGSFPGDRQEQIKMSFASVMRGIVSLRLIPHACGEGRVAAAEVLISTSGIRNNLRKGEWEQIHSAIASGKEKGMQTMEESLSRLAKDGVITWEDALENANKPDDIRKG